MVTKTEPESGEEKREELSEEELRRLEDLDSRHFGFLHLHNDNYHRDVTLIGKGIALLEAQLLAGRKSGKLKKEDEAKLLLKLAHLQLLIQDFPKALSAYQLAAKGLEEGWRDAALYYGLGLVYHHFRAYSAAVEAFRTLVYVWPCWERGVEAELRLGLCCEAQEHWETGLRHLRAALSAVAAASSATAARSEATLSAEEIRFHIALCLDEQNDLRQARSVYEELSGTPTLSTPLKAAVFRQLGWLYYRAEGEPAAQNSQRLETALAWLLESAKLEQSGKTYYYLGRCYSSMSGRAHDAFVNYRHSIDKSEASADTWCSIGVLYQQQQQPMDALQAFVCAVQLEPSHAAAWIDLALLYESVHQFPDALQCFRRAAAHNPPAPQALKARLDLLASEVRKAPALGQGKQPKQTGQLPSLEDAWKLPIPAELTQRQQTFLQQKQERYIKGTNLLTPETTPPYYLSQQQIQMMQTMQQAQSQLDPQQHQILRNLQQQYTLMQAHMKQTAAAGSSALAPHQPFAARAHPPTGPELPQIATDDIESVLGGGTPTALGNTLLEPQGQTTAIPVAPTAAQTPSHPLHKDGRTGSSSTDDFLGALGDNSDDGNAPANDPMLSSAAIKSSDQVKVSKPSTSESGGSLQDACVTSSSGEGGSEAAGQRLLASISVATSDTNEGPESLMSPGGTLAPPPSLNLMAPLNVSLTVSAKEVLSQAKSRASNPSGYKAVCAERLPPPKATERPAVRLAKDKLLLRTPVIQVDARKDASAPELQQHCYAAQAAVIRNLTSALRMDLGLFSTKTLMGAAANDEVEVRTQMRMPVESNLNPFGESNWHFESTRAFTTVSKYAQYQAQTFHHLLREEQERLKAGKTTSTREERGDNDTGVTWGRPPKARLLSSDSNANPYIKFGTNIDLSDERKWGPQLDELRKLPGFLRLVSPANLLTHLGHTVYGMNTLQLYMKVPGCRTPGHQENLCFPSVNINIGPGECEWIAVPVEYWGEIYRLCQAKGVDYLKGSWWPPLEDLWDRDIPVHRFTQKPGDVVWIGPGCVHWVQATGWCNNIAWNIGTPTPKTLSLALERYEFNKFHGYKSIVPMQHLAWQMGRNIKMTDETIFSLVKGVLVRSLAQVQLTLDWASSKGKAARIQARVRGDPAPYCSVCEVEVFCLLFVREESGGGRYAVYCADCARRSDAALKSFALLQQFSLDDLIHVFDHALLHPRRANALC